jgi:predicted glycoside hydrolase/deacetylase ChbG (UPF0249 family)
VDSILARARAISTTRYLIVNADDFGYSYSVNKGIIEAHTKGIVTSTSVMVDALAAQEAAGLAQHKNLSVGLHFAVKDFDNVQQELQRQVTKFITIVGKSPDHIDTHKIYTSHKGFRNVLPAYAKENNIPLRELSGVKFIDSFFGMRSDGDVSLPRLKSALDQATAKYNELMCHVGYSDDYLRSKSSYSDMRERELASICDPSIKKYLKEKRIRLINWTQVPLPLS